MIRVRPRWQRALWWPLILWRYRQAGVSWVRAWQMTHWVIWYPADLQLVNQLADTEANDAREK